MAGHSDEVLLRSRGGAEGLVCDANGLPAGNGD